MSQNDLTNILPGAFSLIRFFQRSDRYFDTCLGCSKAQKYAKFAFDNPISRARGIFSAPSLSHCQESLVLAAHVYLSILGMRKNSLVRNIKAQNKM